MEIISSYISIVFASFITLFPVINPIGTALILNPFFSGVDKEENKIIAKKVAIYAFCLCVVTVLLGQYILEVFGLSIPVVQFAGGIIICKIGWEFMGDKDEESKNEINNSKLNSSIQNKLFYPITFPTTTGAGTIAVLLTLSAHNKGNTLVHTLINLSAIIVAIMAMCILVYVFYSNTTRIIDRWGNTERNVVNKLSAFLVFCVGLDISANGIYNLIKLFNH
jgi:multiple antibiotic resistance protein